MPKVISKPADPMLSIIVPLYNYEPLISRAIDSVVSQLTDQCELIVIDDGSTDGSGRIAKALSERHGLRFLEKENAGLAHTRNLGIGLARGRYITFLDADDYFRQGAIQHMLSSALKSNEKVILFGHHSVEPSGDESYHPPPSRLSDPEAAFVAYGKKSISISSGSAVFERSVFKNILFPEKLRHAEDQPVFALIFANFNFQSSNFSTCSVVKHSTSMRKDADAALKADVHVTNYLFSHPSLPSDMLKYRKLFLSGRLLSLFRTLYRARRYREANKVYALALRESPMSIFQFRYFSKFLKSICYGIKDNAQK